MAGLRQAGVHGKMRRWLSLLAYGFLGLTTGCSGGPTASNQPHDPLHGIMAPPGAPVPSSTPKADASTPLPPNSPGVAAVPASNSSTNPATLAGASWQRPLGQPTRIDDNNWSGPPFIPVSGSVPGKTEQVPGYIPFNANPKVEPVPDVKPANASVTPTGSWQAPADASVKVVVPTANSSNPDLAKQLQARGVIDQRQDVVADGIRLTCYMQRPTGGLRVLEVTAADYASAAQAVLQQLDASR